MRKLLFIPLFFTFIFAKANPVDLPANNYASYFNEAYNTYPEIPRGVLEAVAFSNTRFFQLTDNDQNSCIGMPHAYGVMGLMENGQGWFRNNLLLIDSLSQFSAAEIKSDPRKNILAYAEAFNHCYVPFTVSPAYLNVVTMPLIDSLGIGSTQEENVRTALIALSELPDAYMTDNETDFARKSFVLDTWVYEIFSFVNDEKYASAYNFPQWNANLPMLFGANNFSVLSAASVTIAPGGAVAKNGLHYETYQCKDGKKHRYTTMDNIRVAQTDNVQSADYGPALWNPAATCNYSSRNGTLISAVTIHDVEGTYAGCISWFQNCSAQVSAHYVVRSSDGQITQMVLEANKAWHVGTENPYTIGIEHEGYQAQSGWYTTAMYNASAGLVRDICADYNINPLRTGWWPWLHTTYYNQSNIPGACTKVKGHMHFPNQTHNDPGPYWDWDYFFRLVNNNPPAATVYTTATGNFFDSGGSAGNYSDDERSIWTISPANVSSVTVSFNSFNLENTWDYLYIYDGPDINSPLIGYYTGTNNPGTITSSGGSLTFEFRADCATTASGWDALWSSTAANTNADVTPPTTSLSVNGNWQTADFPVTFSEADNSGGSGLEKSFYQVIDFDGSDWRANNSQGFFSDNFDQATIHPDWTAVTGTWGINNGVLEQSDEVSSNTNIYAPLAQTLSNKYLYNWAGKIDGTGNNRRAGFHFMCDSPSLTNRGNNYFVWFRVDQSVCEFYKVTNDVFTLESSVPMTVNANQWYDWKIIYDRITGEIDVYQDNAFIGSWTDSAPISTGDYVSFRSGNANWQINNFKVYRSRYSNSALTVTVGNCPTCQLRYQNTNPSTPAGRVKSIVRDSANNLSALAWQDINVDWTVPTAIDTINDGPNADIDLSTSPTNLEGNWSASSDPNSGLARYYYALGTTAGDSDVVPWTSNWGYDTIGLGNLSLQTGQWYYWSVRAENGAGLITQNFTSDGVLVDLTTGMAESNGIISASVGPNPFDGMTTISYSLKNSGHVRVSLYDASGKAVVLREENETAGNFQLQIDGENFAAGMYMLRIEVDGAGVTMPVIKK